MATRKIARPGGRVEVVTLTAAEEAALTARRQTALAARDAYVPPEVEPGKLWLELDRRGLLTQAETQIGQIGGAPSIIWRRAAVFYRADPMWNALANRLGISPAAMDGIFRQAAGR